MSAHSGAGGGGA